MKISKKPPPDTVGNILGRISALRTAATQNASMSAKEGQDFVKALEKELNQIAPQMKGLETRLEKTRKTSPTLLVEPLNKPRKEVPRVPDTVQGPVKENSSGRVPADYDDLLATLQNL